MNNMIYVILASLLVIVGMSFVIWNLLKKVERYEEDIVLKDEFILKFKQLTEEAHRKIKELDTMGAFESDDEVGSFFKSLKSISLGLDAYFKNYVTEEDNADTK